MNSVEDDDSVPSADSFSDDVSISSADYVSDDVSVSSADSFSDDVDDVDGDIEIDDGYEFNGFECDEQHDPLSIGKSTVNDSDTEHGAHASTEELYQQCLDKINICLTLLSPEVRATAIRFVNSIKDGGVVFWTQALRSGPT